MSFMCNLQPLLLVHKVYIDLLRSQLALYSSEGFFRHPNGLILAVLTPSSLNFPEMLFMSGEGCEYDDLDLT